MASTNNGREGMEVIPDGGLDTPRPRSRAAVITGAVITTAAAAMSRGVECRQLNKTGKLMAGVRLLAVLARDMLCVHRPAARASLNESSQLGVYLMTGTGHKKKEQKNKIEKTNGEQTSDRLPKRIG